MTTDTGVKVTTNVTVSEVAYKVIVTINPMAVAKFRANAETIELKYAASERSKRLQAEKKKREAAYSLAQEEGAPPPVFEDDLYDACKLHECPDTDHELFHERQLYPLHVATQLATVTVIDDPERDPSNKPDVEGVMYLVGTTLLRGVSVMEIEQWAKQAEEAAAAATEKLNPAGGAATK